MVSLLHRAIVGIVKRLPLPAARFALRGYETMFHMLAPEYVATTYFGSRLHCRLNDLIQRMIFFFGVWEPDVSRVIEQNLRSGDVFVDVGANIGYDTLLASRLVGSAGRVVSIEASPQTFELLRRNLALNSTSANVRTVNAAISDKVGTLNLYEIDADNIGAATTLASRGGRLMACVDALPLDQVLTADEMQRLRLIKIDVEGAEPLILCNILDQLALYPSTMDILVEASPADDIDAWRDVFERMRAAGFSAWAIENGYGLEWYLRWRHPAAPQSVETMPACQQDLLFTRR